MVNQDCDVLNVFQKFMAKNLVLSLKFILRRWQRLYGEAGSDQSR